MPDQTEFLERWFEFHQGYRIVRDAEGTDQRIAVIGEPFKDVSPGFLPRTLDQLRGGIANDARRAENVIRRRRLSSEDEVSHEPQQSLEDALDSLLEEAINEETQPNEDASEARSMGREDGRTRYDPTTPSQPNTAATRARERFARIYGTAEEINQDDYVSPLTAMYSRATERYHQAEARRASGPSTAPSTAALSADELREIEQQIVWSVIRENHTTAQGPFSVTTGHTPPGILGSTPSSSEMRFGPQGSPLPQSSTTSLFPGAIDGTSTPSLSGNTSNTSHIPAGPSSHPPEGSDPSATRSRSSFFTTGPVSAAAVELANAYIDEQRQQQRQQPEYLCNRTNTPELDMDKQNKPPPLEEKDMTRVLACAVCYFQLADHALLPCGHMAMCKWCADAYIPVKNGHFPIRPTTCPVCRKKVTQRHRIHLP